MKDKCIFFLKDLSLKKIKDKIWIWILPNMNAFVILNGATLCIIIPD